MLNIVCHDVQVEPVLQKLTRELLTRGTNQAPDARLDVHAGGFWDRQGFLPKRRVLQRSHHLAAVS